MRCKNTFTKEGLSIKYGLKESAKGRVKNQSNFSGIWPRETKATLGLASKVLRRKKRNAKRVPIPIPTAK
jgi:hypothetical protein